MKNIVSALAAGALLATPLAASAQHGGHGGFGGGHGGFSHASAGRFGGGYHSYGRGFGYRGGYGWRGGYGYYPWGFGLGFALAADPWFYGFPGYGWYYDTPYGCGLWGCGYDYIYDAPPPPRGSAPPPPGESNAAAPPAACGSWVWRTSPNGHYDWVPSACAPAAPAGAPQG